MTSSASHIWHDLMGIVDGCHGNKANLHKIKKFWLFLEVKWARILEKEGR